MAYKTIRKYLDVLEKMSLIEKKGKDLFIKKMSSDAKHRNFCISNFNIDKNKNVFNQLRDLLFLIIQAKKDFIHSLLRLRQNPKRGTDFKKVRRLCKKCCGNPNAEYKEYGISYNRIAKKIGCSVKTAMKVVKDATKRKWCKKKNNCEIVRMDGVNYRDVPGFSFTSLNYGIILRANTYTLSRSWACALCADACEAAIKGW